VLVDDGRTRTRIRRTIYVTFKNNALCSPWGTVIMHKQSIACDPEDVLSLDFEVVDGLRFVLACCVLWLDATHRGGTGKRR